MARHRFLPRETCLARPRPVEYEAYSTGVRHQSSVLSPPPSAQSASPISCAQRHPMPAELAIILPAYNEQASVRKVVLEWFQEIKNWTDNFSFLRLKNMSHIAFG